MELHSKLNTVLLTFTFNHIKTLAETLRLKYRLEVCSSNNGHSRR